jgi:hypothetical protein
MIDFSGSSPQIEDQADIGGGSARADLARY